jgi:hypothetical protein
MGRLLLLHASAINEAKPEEKAQRVEKKPVLIVVYGHGWTPEYIERTIAPSVSGTHDYVAPFPIYVQGDLDHSHDKIVSRLPVLLKGVSNGHRVDILLLIHGRLHSPTNTVIFNINDKDVMQVGDMFGLIAQGMQSHQVNIIVTSWSSKYITRSVIERLPKRAIAFCILSEVHARAELVTTTEWVTTWVNKYGELYKGFPDLSWIETMYLLYGRYARQRFMPPVWIDLSPVGGYRKPYILYHILVKKGLLNRNDASVQMLISDKQIEDLKTTMDMFKDLQNSYLKSAMYNPSRSIRRSKIDNDLFVPTLDGCNTMNTLIFFCPDTRSEFKAVLHAPRKEG